MIGNDIIDFFMEELAKPNASPNRIRQSVKHLTSMSPGASQGRRMLMEQLVDVLFDLYVTGLADAVELGSELKLKLNRYAFAPSARLGHPGIVLSLRKAVV